MGIIITFSLTLPSFWLTLQHQTEIKLPETLCLLHFSRITFDFERKGKKNLFYRICLILNYDFLFSFPQNASLTSFLYVYNPINSRTDYTLSELSAEEYPGSKPPSRAEAGKSRQPFVPAERCVPHYGNMLLSNLLPMRPWDVQQLLTLILKLKPSFLQHVMLGHLNHDRTCISNSKCYMLFSCRFSSSQKPLLQTTKSHTVAVVLPAH